MAFSGNHWRRLRLCRCTVLFACATWEEVSCSLKQAKIFPPPWLNVTLGATLRASLLALVMLIRRRRGTSTSLPMCLHACASDIGVGDGGAEGGGSPGCVCECVGVTGSCCRVTSLSGQLSSISACPGYLHSRTLGVPSAPAHGSSVTAEHMWPKYSKQSFIKSSTKTAQCDSRPTNDAWRPLNAPLTDQRPACHALPT